MDDAHPPVSDQEAREAVAGPQTHEASLVGLRPSTALVAVVLSVAVAAGGAVSALINYDLVGLGHLPRVGVFIVFVLIAVNALSMVIVRRRALSSGQIAFIYMAILVMAGIPGQQLVTYLYLGMIGSQYYAYGQGNDYATEVIPYLKPWLVPSMDPEGPVIAWAFHGLPWGESIPWQAWVRPLACWTPYILALLGLQICLASLFRRRWDQERLTYPLARVPVELASYRTGADAVPELLRSRLFWAAFVLPVAVYTQKALSFHNPDIRGVNLYKDIGVVFGAAPWSNLDYLPLHIYFESIGHPHIRWLQPLVLLAVPAPHLRLPGHAWPDGSPAVPHPAGHWRVRGTGRPLPLGKPQDADAGHPGDDRSASGSRHRPREPP
jgi:hypothetical protein